MNFHVWHYCIVINYLIINYSTAKPFSLNEALAAELDQKQITETSSSKLPEQTAERFSLNKVLKPTLTKSNHIFKESGNIFSRVKKLSPLKYKKKFEIKTPLKPKNLKRSPKYRFRRKNQSIKREINGNDQLYQKYIPLLKNIGMLFDNLLMSGESDSYEARSQKYKRNKYRTIFSEERNAVECSCAHRNDNEHAEIEPPEETITLETSTAKISIDSEDVAFITTTAETTDNSSVSDFGGVGLYKNLSLLFPRNTVSSRGNDNGIGERSGSSHNRSAEGNLTWYYGNSEHGTECGKNESFTKNGDEISCNAPRNSASGDGSHEQRRRNRNLSGSTNPRFTSKEDIDTKEKENFSEARHYPNYEGQDKLDMGRNETKSTKSLSELIRRLRGFISEIEVNNSTDIIQSKTIHKESIINDTHNNSSDKRFAYRNGTNTEKVEKFIPRNETMIHTKSSLLSETDSNKPSKAPPVLMIIDGYSVTRHKNGENKLSKKAIHIHS